jgi:hypothetical protein
MIKFFLINFLANNLILAKTGNAYIILLNLTNFKNNINSYFRYMFRNFKNKTISLIIRSRLCNNQT